MKKVIFYSLAIATGSYTTSLAHTSGTDTVKTVTIKVTNLHCNNDMPTIKKRLLNQEGIDEVSFTGIQGETSTFTISYHTSVTGQDQIEKVVETTPGCDDKNDTPYKVKRAGSRKKDKS